MTPQGMDLSAARAVEEGLDGFLVVGDVGSLFARPFCGGTLRAMDSLLAEPPDATGGKSHQFLVARVISDRLPPLQCRRSYLIDPLVLDSSDHVRAAELAAQRELDHQISLLPVSHHLDPIPVV